MLEVVKKSSLPDQGVKYTIDGKGTIIYALPDGGKIRDSGWEITFNSKSGHAKTLAVEYASNKWAGNKVIRDGSTFYPAHSTDEPYKDYVKKGINHE